MAAMLLQNVAANRYAGAAPTFTMSDAPVFTPLTANTYKAFQPVMTPCFEGGGSEDENSDRTNSTHISSLTSSNKPSSPEMFLDIEKVHTTYFMNANRRLVSPFLSAKCSNADVREEAEPASINAADPLIRVALNQRSCLPGDKLEGTIFCDISGELENIGICQNVLEEEIKLLITFQGVECASIISETGEIFCTKRDVYRKTKEVTSFKKVIPSGMHCFDFCFDLPETLPPSCNVHGCHLGRTGGVGTITYSAVATIQGSVGIVSFQGNGNIVVQAPTSGAQSSLQSAKKVSKSRNHGKILRFLTPASNHQNHKSSSNGGRKPKSPPNKPSARISLENDKVSVTGQIVLKVDTGKVKHGLLKTRKLSVKVIRIIELRTDEMNHKWETTVLERSFEVRKRLRIDLSAVESKYQALYPTAQSDLIVNKYIVQVRAKASFGVLGGISPVCLPVTLVADEACSVLFSQCNGLCRKLKNAVHLKSRNVETTAEDAPAESRRLAEEKLLFVKNESERGIIETKLLALSIATQQMADAKKRAAEAECELRETIKKLSASENS